MNDEIRCSIEYRADDSRESPGRIIGTLLVYGERAGDRPEVFAPDSLTFADGGLVLNRQHERRNPIMRFTPELRGRELVIDAKLPNTSAGRDAAAEVKSGLLRGLSIEFVSKREENRGGLRTILSGELRARALSIRQVTRVRRWRFVGKAGGLSDGGEGEAFKAARCGDHRCRYVEVGRQRPKERFR